MRVSLLASLGDLTASLGLRRQWEGEPGEVGAGAGSCQREIWEMMSVREHLPSKDFACQMA